MPKMVLLGDTGSHPGHMVSASSTFRINDTPVCLEGDLYYCELRGHGTTPVKSPAAGPVCQGRNILYTGATAECGCVIVGTAPVDIAA